MHLTARSSQILIISLLGLILPSIALAQSNRAEGRSGHWYLGGGFGGFSEESNTQLVNTDSSAALFFSGGFRASPHVSVEADLLGWEQDFSTPASISPGVLSTAQARTDLTTSGLAAVVKFYLPAGMVDLYAGGGLGFYASELSVQGTGGSNSAEINESDTDLGYQLLLGADIYVSTKLSVGVEYRYLNVETNFEQFIPGNLDVGGQFFLLNVRGHF